MDVLRAVAFAFRLASKPFRVTCGLLGALSYDFVDQFEKLPASGQDLLGNPDYELYFADNIFLMDHESNQGYVVVNCMITNGDREAVIAEAQSSFDYYFNMARFDPPKGRKHSRPPAGGLDRHGPARIRGHGRAGQAAHPRRRHLPGGPEPDADGAVPR